MLYGEVLSDALVPLDSIIISLDKVQSLKLSL